MGQIHPASNQPPYLVSKSERTLTMITKMLVGSAIVLSAFVVGTAPVNADPRPSDPHPNPFGSLTCSCQQTTPVGGPVLTQEIDRGLSNGLARR
jgi:hypothetical protein